eukprot:SAG31_NODE_4326_length_3354_cov_11.627035_6_plen_40_part_00
MVRSYRFFETFDGSRLVRMIRKIYWLLFTRLLFGVCVNN